MSETVSSAGAQQPSRKKHHGFAQLGLLAGRERQLLLLSCGLCYFAQSFVAWGWPALDGYPAMERWLDPSFLPADFYTNTTNGSGVDTWQAVLFGSIQRWTGIHYAVQIALLTALRHLLWPWVLYRFFNTLLRDETAALTGVVLGVLAEFLLPKMLCWSWLWGDGSPAMMAVFVMTIAWTEMLRKRAWLGFLLLGVATIMQPLVGLHGAIFAAAIFLFGYSRAELIAATRQPANYAGGLAFLAIFLWQYFALSPPAAERLPVEDYVRILVWERHPGDFLLSRVPASDWLAWAFGVFAVGVMGARIWRCIQGRALIAAGLAAYASICVAGYLFVELKPERLVIDLIPFRTLAFGAPLLLAITGCFGAEMMRSGRWTVAAAMVLAFALAGSYGRRFGFPLAGASALLLGSAVLGVLPRPVPEQSADQRGILLVRRLAILGLLAAAIPVGVARFGFMRIPDQANQHPLYAWAAEATPPNARFLVEQFSSDRHYADVISPQLMRLVGRRAVVASRDYPFRDSDARAWLATWAIALDHGRANRVERASADDLRAICARLPYHYVVRRNAFPKGQLRQVAVFGPAAGLGPLRVYEVCH
ncbi:MAG: hypothetical protein ABI454_05625 [Sphingomicrobium sp.]